MLRFGVALALACMLCLGGLTHFSDVDTLRDERRQQEMAARFVARSLDTRIETYQRVLQSMGQGVHSSMLDSPYVLELLLREDAGYTGIFDTLVMAGYDGSLVSYVPSGEAPADSSALRDVLRRTLNDGKPRVGQQPWEETSPLLGLLLTVPLRQADGAVRGALAGVVRIPPQSLLPQQDDTEDAQDQQFMLLDAEGLLLAHSQTQNQQALGHVPQVLQSHGSAWDRLSSTTTSNADTQLWGTLLLTRVGLPLPRWQVVVVRDVSAPLRGMQRLEPWQWLGLISLAVVMALALLGMLEWLQRRLSRLQARNALALEGAALPQLSSEGVQEAATASPPQMPWPMSEASQADYQPTVGELESALVQMMEAMPMGVIWARGNVLHHASRRAGWLLGMEPGALVGLSLEQLLQGQSGARAWIVQAMESLIGFGQFRSELGWQQPGGRAMGLQVQVVVLQPAELGILWLLEDAESLHQIRGQANWLDAHDRLTGLPNRQTLVHQLQAWCATAAAPTPMALLWVDVDYFTAFNATAGRAAGDEVLRQVAWLLHRERGLEGMAARMEGDAFVLCLRQTQEEGSVQALAWRLCDVAQAWSPRVGPQCYALGLSVGWLRTEVAGVSAPALLRAAEAACREAKQQGQGRAVQGRMQAEPRPQ
ncbi:diguanylate cyclase domain-containing protein [Comamonas sp. GB3 AK4-5]|uniref:sensor domain-containing diguanylate cyclase n=1 Tax=Comamonas sp. GB3 AK4-5 TaxID=3231487 RepID=UPI00351F7183